MRTTTITRLDVSLYYCQALPADGGAAQAAAALQAQGATFLNPGGLRPMTEPGGHINEEGSIIAVLQFQYPLLLPDTDTLRAIHQGRLQAGDDALGNFAYLADSRTVVVSQGAEFPDGRPRDGLADGLLALALRLYPRLRPAYGWVDESGWNVPSKESVERVRPRFVFWATLYGPGYVAALGREFLEGAPVWRVVDLGDGGLLHVACESYEAWWHNDQPELLAYFRRRLPRIRVYRAQPVPF